ncbi:MAG: YlxM family DNA-binding protein [Clostridia bacterium]|nr:YlxM family DNA-binding protein [Clostridia bacterium]
MFEKNLQIGYLLDFYGGILPQRKREIMELYYNDDLSLSEVAEQFGITRQAVRETVKKTEEELFFYEERLGLLARFRDAQTHTDTALSLCRELQSRSDGTDTVDRLMGEINTISTIVAAESK